MKCSRLHLRERTKSGSYKPLTPEKPRRYCQKRLVDPNHEEDPRWINVFERFHCNEIENTNFNESQNNISTQEEDNLFLSVQNLKFQGEDEQRIRPRSCYKYKTVTDGNKHRMFVKQEVPRWESVEDDRSSQLTCYYYDDYAKYLSNTDPSRPSSAKSSIFLQGSSTRFKENKAVQVDFSNSNDNWKPRKVIFKPKTVKKKEPDNKQKLLDKLIAELPKTAPENTKIMYENTGKRKSLTISRAESPETVQVIRVDVVCNYSNTPPSSAAATGDKAQATDVVAAEKVDKNTETARVKPKRSHFANKYLLTNSIKTLDESVSGGAKVTLLCKTFRLTDRSKLLSNNKSR